MVVTVFVHVFVENVDRFIPSDTHLELRELGACQHLDRGDQFLASSDVVPPIVKDSWDEDHP